ncbi:hypothetical protein F2Q69_00053849 [Brassica cretica]|uniref:Uncharacterized protein n=1 Tax=Brassica cretica TaxID=69181 RepID=A0A8S9N277_BRACR|nr:hypothetical protein F2Q69_00053849 [Brassica cretica]
MLFAATAQVYGGRIHESVESIEMISGYEIKVSLKFSKGARISYYHCRVQGVFALDFYGIVRRFSEGFHDVLGFNLPGISVASGVLIYREGCCRRVEGNRLMRVRLCVIMRVYSWVEVQRTRSYKAAIFRGNAVWFSNQIWHMRGNKWVYMVSRLQTVQNDAQDKVFILVVAKEIFRKFGVYGLLKLDKD